MVFVPLRFLLKKSVKKSPASKQIEAALILKNFSKQVAILFGESMAKRIKPMYFKDGVIAVASLSSIALIQIKLKEEKILQKINEELGQGTVNRLRFV